MNNHYVVENNSSGLHCVQVLLDVLYPEKHHNSNDTSNKLKNVMKLQEVEELLSGHASIVRNKTETEP